MDRVGPSCSWQQCAAPPTTPRIKLFHGLTCAKKTRPRRATAPDFPGYTASPQGTPQLFRDGVQFCSGLVDFQTPRGGTTSVHVVRGDDAGDRLRKDIASLMG